MKDLGIGFILAGIILIGVTLAGSTLIGVTLAGIISGNHSRNPSSEPEQCYNFTVYVAGFGQNALKTNNLIFNQGAWTFTTSDGVSTLVPMTSTIKIEDNNCEV